MTNMDIAHQRLLNQRIAGEKLQTPEEVVKWMGAMQAQDYLQALWAIGLRLQSATVADVERAIAERKILRTWPMRGTIHFVPSEDAKWMLKLSTPRVLAGAKRRLEQLKLDQSSIERAKQLFFDTLKGDKQLSRPEMMDVLREAGISPDGQRGYHILWHVSQIGLICLGPTVNKQQTFALLDEWVPQSRELSREEALAELAKRFFVSHGPATLQDFARWTGLTMGDSKMGLEEVKVGLRAEKMNGQEYWMPKEVPTSSEDRIRSLDLLPGFDEYLLGYKDRNAILALEHASKVIPGNNGVFMPTIMVKGQVVGTWKRTLGKNGVSIKLVPFTSLTEEEERMAMEEARRYGDFLEVPLVAASIGV